jgi:glycosyltransferase involved in cell wall biosynthesis
MQVLVYGKWPNEPAHIQPFISATYYDRDKVAFQTRDYTQTLELVFAASLVPGKRPLLTVQIIEALNNKGYPALLHMFGDGPLRAELEAYIEAHNLEEQVQLYGNRDIQELKAYYQKAHFNILPSKSEGWPKAVAEGMFFGCVPVTTKVSCVDWMLGYGSRGLIIEPQVEAAVALIIEAIKSQNLERMAREAQNWSEQYTFDRLEADIEKVLKSL